MATTQTKKPFSTRINLSGQRFGRLFVGDFVGKNKHGHVLWECQCSCNNVVIVSTQQLRKGKTKSCGCYSRDLTRKRNKERAVHAGGMCDTPEYRSFLAAKSRCENTNNSHYKDYGARGIKLEMNFQEMLDAIGNKPSKKHSLDRIDVDGNYSSYNIRWATDLEQAHNQRRNKTAGVQRRESGRWRAYISVNKQWLHLGTFDTKRKALQARQEAMNKYWYGNLETNT